MTKLEQASPQKSAKDPFGVALLIGLIAGLAWVPFWLGANRPFAWGINGLYFPSLALAYEGAVLSGRRRHAVALRFVGVPAALFVAAVIWALIQCTVNVPESMAHPIWQVAGDSLGQSTPKTISVNPSQTALAVLRLVTAASVFWLSLQLCREARRAHYLLAAIAVVVALYAAYGLVLAIFAEGQIPFFDAPVTTGGVRSTFVNRNHFATYAGLGLVTCVGLLLRRFEDAVVWDTKSALRALAGNVLWIALLGITLAALLGSTSRGGVLAAALGLLALFGLVSRHIAAERAAIGLMVAAVSLAIGFVFFSDALFSRVSSVGLGGASRIPTYWLILGSIRDNPLLGLGYGAFLDAFPLYRDQSIPTIGVWDKAHNTYLEVWQGLGLVFGTALIASVVLLAIKCFVGARKRRRDYMTPAVSAAGCVLVGFHALVDFSVQIEAVALTFMAMLGAGVAQSRSSREALGD